MAALHMYQQDIVSKGISSYVLIITKDTKKLYFLIVPQKNKYTMKFFVQRLKPLFQYDSKEDDLNRRSNKSEEDDKGEIPVEELFKKPKKGEKGRTGQWTEHLANDLVDIILNNDKYKEKLLLTNVKNIKNSQYHNKVIEELKERCSERGEKLPFNVEQTRQKFKPCINICRDAVMKVKTSSGIKHFQQDK